MKAVKMRQYESIWLAIKALPVGKELAVRVHATAARRVIQAVKLEKTKEVSPRKKIGMMRQGNLVIRQAEDTKGSSEYATLYFSLAWDGTKL